MPSRVLRAANESGTLLIPDGHLRETRKEDCPVKTPNSQRHFSYS